MSRSYGGYDADWQRRKSVLIRSLFHDIPILSPVEEESSDSYYVPSEEVFASPPRPYTPLPPLIIEKVPITNKHDEPEEYYSKLYRKIKTIYTKLFIEKLNFSSIDYDSNYSDSSVDDDNEHNNDGSVENLGFQFLECNSPGNGNFDSIIEDREARQSSASTKSNGYGADFESMDTAIIDVVNYTPSNEEAISLSEEEEESESENIEGDGIRKEDSDNSRSSGNKEFSTEKIDDLEFIGGEESHHSIMNDHKMTESEESNEAEDEQSYEKENSDNEHEVILETSKSGESYTVRTDDPVFTGGEESHHSSIDDHEKTESEESNPTENEQDTCEKKLKLKKFEKTASEDGSKVEKANIEPMEGDVETSDCSEGPVYRQITTAAMVHFDGSEDAGERESRVYEDSVKSVILPTRFRRVVMSRNVDVDDRIEVLPLLEENADSITVPTFYTDESETTEDSEDSEEVATPQLEAKEEGIIEEDDEETSTPRLDAPEEDDEPQSAEQDLEEIERPQPAAREEETEEMGIEEEDEEMSTSQPESAEEDLERMERTQRTARDEEIEEMGIEEDEEMSTPQPESPEEDVEEMRTPQPAAREKETKATEEDLQEMGTPHPIEQMRTPRTHLSHGTISITHRSHSESTTEHTAVPQELTDLTSSPQDGVGHNMSEIQTSNDMNEILTSIFKESRNKDGTPISGRKRKLVDKSVQAVQTRVTWEEIRANFFVGTPKIFRLCACTDHVCY